MSAHIEKNKSEFYMILQAMIFGHITMISLCGVFLLEQTRINLQDLARIKPSQALLPS